MGIVEWHSSLDSMQLPVPARDLLRIGIPPFSYQSIQRAELLAGSVAIGSSLNRVVIPDSLYFVRIAFWSFVAATCSFRCASGSRLSVLLPSFSCFVDPPTSVVGALVDSWPAAPLAMFPVPLCDGTNVRECY